MKNVLFLCNQNRLRSPTGEKLFSNYPNVKVKSAGFASDAEKLLTDDLVKWADIIFVMESWHVDELKNNFKDSVKDKRLVCLDIPDRYDYMDPELVYLLESKVINYLIT